MISLELHYFLSSTRLDAYKVVVQPSLPFIFNTQYSPTHHTEFHRAMSPYTYINASCHCELNTFRVAFPTESLPISSDLCHCDTCRHSSGQLVVYHVNIHGRPLELHSDDPIDLSDMTQYKSGPHTTRYFCPICSAHLLWENKEKEDAPYYCVAAGSLERVDGIVNVDYHIFVEDTKDGGLSEHLKTDAEGKELARYAKAKDSETLPLGWNVLEQTAKPPSDDEKLHAYCACKAIQFSITRPNEDSSLPYAAYPDLLKPYDVTHLSKVHNSDNEKWWLRPVHAEKPTKYLAGHCACRSCRLTSGFPIQSWAFVPRTNLIDPHTGTSVELDDGNRLKGLKQYISSPGRYREFCPTCGATVFWWNVSRPDIIDVSVGLVDQEKEGARAERWLDWHKERVSFEEMALARQTIQALEEGLKASATP
ncbi:Mss4-like protein [Crucibulum laeve]|uniref:Mss4-like protein n=1 Tax=Crucibulum laeve TaxID=68775 RepID=A0A5C3M0I3_9AGAR|nr:Mss4-like protein [Crucibulum laeve]